MNNNEWLAREKRGPRINALLEHFAKIASGEIQKPKIKVTPDDCFVAANPRRADYAGLLNKNIGTFNNHAFASIPFFIEETIRLGLAIFDYSVIKKASIDNPLTFWSTSSADASHARTLAEYAGGKIVTFSDTPNDENREEFDRLLSHLYSFLFMAPYFEITKDNIRKRFPKFPLKDGFDIIWEDTTFQMYSGNRDGQIAHVKKQLKPGGLLILFEKVANNNQADYLLNEYNKDRYFKSRYFSYNEILEKERGILKDMYSGQVTEDELILALQFHFTYAYKIWACGNFVEFIASNSKEDIEQFISCLPEPYTPEEVAGRTAIKAPQYVSVDTLSL